KINDRADGHADAGCAEAIAPHLFVAERAADILPDERAEIDADIKNRIGAVDAVIAGFVEARHLRRDIRFEPAIAENEKQQCEIEIILERHEEMADGHKDAAYNDGISASKPAVRQIAANKRREVDETCISTVDRGLQLLWRCEIAIDKRKR